MMRAADALASQVFGSTLPVTRVALNSPLVCAIGADLPGLTRCGTNMALPSSRVASLSRRASVRTDFLPDPARLCPHAAAERPHCRERPTVRSFWSAGRMVVPPVPADGLRRRAVHWATELGLLAEPPSSRERRETVRQPGVSWGPSAWPEDAEAGDADDATAAYLLGNLLEKAAHQDGDQVLGHARLTRGSCDTLT